MVIWGEKGTYIGGKQCSHGTDGTEPIELYRYRKVPLDIRNVSNIGFEKQWHLNLSHILVGFETVTQKTKNTVHYSNAENGKVGQQMPFYIGYKNIIRYSRSVGCVSKMNCSEQKKK